MSFSIQAPSAPGSAFPRTLPAARVANAPLPAALEAESGLSGTSFVEVLKGAISDTSALQDRSREAIEAFIQGEPVELHEVMTAATEAQLSLEILVEGRNRLLQAYHTLVTLQ